MLACPPALASLKNTTGRVILRFNDETSSELSLEHSESQMEAQMEAGVRKETSIEPHIASTQRHAREPGQSGEPRAMKIIMG